MINALQATDALMSGFAAGIDAIRQRNEVRVEIERQAYGNQLMAWQRYAARLEIENDQRRAQSAAAARENQELRDQAKLVNSRVIDRLSVMYRRIERLDERLQRTSASLHSMCTVRDFLLAEIKAHGDPETFTALSSAKRAEVEEAAWSDFMTNQNVRLGVPKM
jgi:hypothetical protein